MAMQNLDIKKIDIFGWSLPKSDCWWYIIGQAISNGWRGWQSIDVKKVEQSLKTNILSSYNRLFSSVFEDLDDSIHYTVYFDNQKRLFNLELTNTKTGEILPEQKKEFFKSEIFKKTAARAYEILVRAKDQIEKFVMKHIEQGELLEIDEIKLEAIVHMLNDQVLMKNFRLAKYAK